MHFYLEMIHKFLLFIEIVLDIFINDFLKRKYITFKYYCNLNFIIDFLIFKNIKFVFCI